MPKWVSHPPPFTPDLPVGPSPQEKPSPLLHIRFGHNLIISWGQGKISHVLPASRRCAQHHGAGKYSAIKYPHQSIS
jgi:hypothetical protein